MQEFSFRSPAKLNLALDVEQLPNNNKNKYHILKMITQTIDIFDCISILKTRTNKINIVSSGFEVPLNCDNIIYKAVLKFFETTQIVFTGLDIKIFKNIPVQAGLGGGSSNAAMTLLALNKIFSANLSLDELQKIAISLGADVPLFFFGGTCLCEGIGEKVTLLKDLKDVCSDVYFVVVKPDVGFSTAEIYNRFDNIEIKKRPDINRIISEISNNNVNNIFENIYNVLEEAIDQEQNQNKKVFEIKSKLTSLGALTSQMTGSGSAVFGVFLSKLKAQESFEILKQDYKNIFLCRPITGKDYLNF